MTLLNCHTLLTGWLILPCRSAEAGCCSWSAAADWSRQSCVPLPSCGMSCDSHIRSLSSHVTAHCVVAVRSCDHHMSAVKSCDSHVIAIWSHGNTFCNSCQSCDSHVTITKACDISVAHIPWHSWFVLLLVLQVTAASKRHETPPHCIFAIDSLVRRAVQSVLAIVSPG